MLESRRQNHFAHLALVAELISHQQVLDDLLRDRRSALRTPGLCQVPNETAYQRPLVYSFMLMETFVFCGDKRLLHVSWNISQADPDPALVALVDLSKTLALEVEHLACA